MRGSRLSILKSDFTITDLLLSVHLTWFSGNQGSHGELGSSFSWGCYLAIAPAPVKELLLDSCSWLVPVEMIPCISEEVSSHRECALRKVVGGIYVSELK